MASRRGHTKRWIGTRGGRSRLGAHLTAPLYTSMESVLEAIDEEDDAALETLDSDVEMFDAETLADTTCLPPPQSRPPATATAVATGPPFPPGQTPGLKPKKKKNKKKGRKAAAAPNITDVNRFVIDTCMRLKERKSYLVWNAVGCHGVSAVRDLVKEVATSSLSSLARLPWGSRSFANSISNIESTKIPPQLRLYEFGTHFLLT